MCGSIKGSPAERGIESRFAHRTVALVKVSSEFHRMSVGAGLVVAQWHHQLGSNSLLQRRCNVIGWIVLHVRMLQQPVGNGSIVLRMIGNIGHRAFAHIEVPRQSGVACELGRLGPQVVIANRVLVGHGQPLLVVLASLLVGGVLGHDHRGQKRWLRTREIVSTIGIEDRAVVFNLVEEVLDDAARVVALAVFQQPDDDEVAVPAIHFVEAAAWDNVFVRQVKQTMRVQLLDRNGPEAGNFLRQVLDLNSAFAQCRNCRRRRHPIRQVEHRGRSRSELRIRDR